MGMLAELGTDDLRRLVPAIGQLSPSVDDADRIDRIRLLEELKAAIAAAQSTVAVEFDRSQRLEQARAGVPAAQQGRGVSAQVALARRVSPWQGQRWLGWSKILLAELPATYAQLRAGRTTEWRAMLIARETAVLSREGRAAVDGELAPHLEGWGDRRVENEARKTAYRLDPGGSVARAAAAESDRRVSVRPAPDTMCRLSGLLPVAQGVAAYAALRREADRLIAHGDARGRGQIMADTLVERLTGQAQATDVPIEITMVMTDQNLTGNRGTSGWNEPAWLEGYGAVPAQWARGRALGDKGGARRWIRHAYTGADGRLVALGSHRREFTPGQRAFLRLRDQTCRTAWCDAPIRHADHVRAAAAGGPTHVDNGQGLCEGCNYAKQAPGWHCRAGPNGTIIITTPTGHAYSSSVPDPPRRRPGSPCERRLAALLTAA